MWAAAGSDSPSLAGSSPFHPALLQTIVSGRKRIGEPFNSGRLKPPHRSSRYNFDWVQTTATAAAMTQINGKRNIPAGDSTLEIRHLLNPQRNYLEIWGNEMSTFAVCCIYIYICVCVCVCVYCIFYLWVCFPTTEYWYVCKYVCVCVCIPSD